MLIVIRVDSWFLKVIALFEMVDTQYFNAATTENSVKLQVIKLCDGFAEDTSVF